MSTPASHMPKAYIFGAGQSAKALLPAIQNSYQVMGFFDNDPKKWKGTIENLPIFAPRLISEMAYDAIVIASLTGVNPITMQLLSMGVEPGKINSDYVVVHEKSRILFLEKLGLIFSDKGIEGCVAEGGVFQGEFAKNINRVFPAQKLFLFDTFTGFDERDVAVDKREHFSEVGAGNMHNTSEELVMGKMPHPDMCVIRKGYFPQTTEGIDEVFSFVNLDFDLYQPILSGLEFFYPRMVKGGIILIHDYFSDGFRGVKDAVRDYAAAIGQELALFPIGDGISIGIHC